MFVYFWESEWGMGTQLLADSSEPNAGLQVKNHEIVTQAKSLLLKWLSHPGASGTMFLYEK